MKELNDFEHKGWVKFKSDERVVRWANAANLKITSKLKNKEIFDNNLTCQGTWFVGVDALENDTDGALGEISLSGPFESLISLAEFLQTEKEVNIILVGHTDNKGSFEVNLALSKRRAQAVAGYLADEFGIDPARIMAQGVAYLSPVASNDSEAGRRQNKRVEVLLQR